MATEFFMPTLGMNQETGKIIEWLVAEGQDVTKGQPIMVVETDKATVELEAPATGKLVNVTAKDGDVVPVGKVIALILKEGETVPELARKSVSNLPVTVTAVGPRAAATSPVTAIPVPAAIKFVSPLAARVAEENGIDLSQVPCSGRRIQKEDVLAYLTQRQAAPQARDRKKLASPKARRLAREQNLDLHGLAGSGPQGAVLEMDVGLALTAQTVPTTVVADTPVPAMALQTFPTSRAWQVMAQRLTESWQTVPHFYLQVEADTTQLKTRRASLLERCDENVTYTDLIVKLVAVALRQHPRLNASWVNGAIHTHTDINICLAVAVEEGLLVPVIRNADQLGIQALAAKRKNMVSAAQSNRLAATDLSGGTFTISNLGMFGIEAFHAIINPPEAAILALGQIVEKVVPVKGQPAIQPRMVMVLSCDHRVVDGVRAAQFLQTLVRLIEDPLTALD